MQISQWKIRFQFSGKISSKYNIFLGEKFPKKDMCSDGQKLESGSVGVPKRTLRPRQRVGRKQWMAFFIRSCFEIKSTAQDSFFSYKSKPIPAPPTPNWIPKHPSPGIRKSLLIIFCQDLYWLKTEYKFPDRENLPLETMGGNCGYHKCLIAYYECFPLILFHPMNNPSCLV